jgi:hypothetical protein
MRRHERKRGAMVAGNAVDKMATFGIIDSNFLKKKD